MHYTGTKSFLSTHLKFGAIFAFNSSLNSNRKRQTLSPDSREQFYGVKWHSDHGKETAKFKYALSQALVLILQRFEF